MITYYVCRVYHNQFIIIGTMKMFSNYISSRVSCGSILMNGFCKEKLIKNFPSCSSEYWKRKVGLCRLELVTDFC